MNDEELDERIAQQAARLANRPEPPQAECAASPTGKHDTTGNTYHRANGHVCRYCGKLVD